MDGSMEPVVRRFIADSFMYREGLAALQDDDSLLDKGLVDSTGVLELVFFLEQTFAIKVGDDEVLPENLDSVRQICAFVKRKREPASQAWVA